MLTVVTIGTHSSTNPTRGFSVFCFLFPDALIIWMTLKYKQANRCAQPGSSLGGRKYLIAGRGVLCVC